MLRVMSLTLWVTLCWGQGQDATTRPGSIGPGVVDAAVERIRSSCIFSEDRLFLRRTAYVMSRDGMDSATYRPGFDGGIWQVSRSMFMATHSCTNSAIMAACRNIQSKLKIDWSKVTWSDLRKPLYSGIAAALSALSAKGNATMAGDISDQAILWSRMYNQPRNIFVTKAPNTPVFKCQDNLDLVFILDSSGSVSSRDFTLMKKFAASVVDALDVSSQAVRVADIVFSSPAKVFFDFDDYSDKATLKRMLLNTTYLNGQTNTNLALDLARRQLYGYNYNINNGARRNVRKVAVLVTDGKSSSFARTVQAARSLKDAGTTVFAIGVGNYRESELKAVASDPVCTHVLTLTAFDKIHSIVTEIQKGTCQANYKLTAGTKTITGVLTKKPTATTIDTSVPDPTKTIQVSVSCGILAIYVSKTNPKPGPFVFDYFYKASPGVPATLRTVETLTEGTHVYITVVGTRLPKSVADLRKCSDFNWTISEKKKSDIQKVTIICQKKGARHTCTCEDIANAGVCSGNEYLNLPLENPCTRENLEKGILRHPHPYDPTKFLQCNKQGRYYVTLCPGGAHFITLSRDCSFSSSPVEDEEPPNPKNCTTSAVMINSACTPEALAKHQYYHAYAEDAKKFIQCDAWGTAYLKNCAKGTVWSQTAYTCIHAPRKVRSATATPATTTTATATATSKPCVHNTLYPILCEPGKFHICNHGKLVVVVCPSGLLFNSTANYCDWPPAVPQPLPASCQP